jgi:hypothetical protein
MRVQILIGATMLLVSMTSPGRAQRSTLSAVDSAALDSAREAVWRAWFAGDTVALSKLVPGALAAGSSWAPWDDRAATLQAARASAMSGTRLVDIRFDSSTVTLDGNVAVMRSRFTYTTETATHQKRIVTGRATEIFVREQGKWLNPFWYLE